MSSLQDWGPYDELDHSNRQAEFIIVTVVFTVVATIFALGRLYTRMFVVRTFGNDDWCIFLAVLCLWASSMTSVIYMQRGRIGYHMWDITFDPVRFTETQKMGLANQLLYNPVLALTKASLLLFYLRLSVNTAFHRCIWTTMWFTIGLGISAFITDLLQCTPVAFFWDSSIVGGKCINQFLFYFITAAISTATDLWILLLPMPIFWGLQIPARQRITLISLFALGFVVVAMSVLRLNALHRVFFRTIDPTYDDVYVWANMELTLAVVCACVPALRPLVPKLFPHMFSTAAESFQKSSGRAADGSNSTTRRMQKAENYGLEELGITDTNGVVYGTGASRSTNNDSEEMIIGKLASDLTPTPSPRLGCDMAPQENAHVRDGGPGTAR